MARLVKLDGALAVGAGGVSGQYQRQIIIQLDTRTLAQAVVSGLPPVVRVGTGLRGY